MQDRQREHIATVMQVADAGLASPWARHHDEVIRSSWLRCVHEHRLDPARMQEAVILPGERVREHQDQLEDFLQIARHGLESLYQQVAGLGYVVLLTDARGVTVDFLGDIQLDHQLQRAGLYLGADWSERHAGTCGVGTCITTGEALTVHQEDHFDATHIPLTCTTAPIFDTLGRLSAVLDISALTSPQAKESQHLALQMVKMYAHQIENASFLQRYRRDWVLRLSGAPQFLDVNPEYLLAIDAGGRVIGHNRRAQMLFEADGGGPLVGRGFEHLFDVRFNELGRFVRMQPVDQRAVKLAGSTRLLFLLASPPLSPLSPLSTLPAPAQSASGAPRNQTQAAQVPAPLAALSGGDPQLDRQIARVARLLNSPVSLLLNGETGTGKEYFAKAVHQSSERRRGPFIAVNCAAIPESLIESELFGYLPGSFSGASARGKRGLIAEADGGTLFLDEIGDMPRPLQARLLRVLAEKEVLPIGGTRPVSVNIRVIAATHCNLEKLVREGGFRDDLYYRLNGAHILLPTLRERQDFSHMVRHMLRQHARQHDLPAPPDLAPATLALMRGYPWPGNLRELRNVIEYAAAVCMDGLIQPDDLPEQFHGNDACRLALPLPAHAQGAAATLPEAERLLTQLRACGWNISAAAQQMGIARMTLYRRMKRLGIATPNQRDRN
ncbi:sigma-54-dependent Fis family transcriptional regulator [Noviherbaspirillum aerium]|uniref:sigma-54-dependent Fis family transcriptional regulator n=1 Tax=Noviherbaspirillum aerium TaxID=2588497 RepID=UPI00124C165A|nr:sigma-54-dependent Fis family transcriptional regulator [Noviherbaspirillum aerium]